LETETRCAFYRNFGSPRVGQEPGLCEFDGTSSICDGEIGDCVKLNVLRRYLMERNWMKATAEAKKA